MNSRNKLTWMIAGACLVCIAFGAALSGAVWAGLAANERAAVAAAIAEHTGVVILVTALFMLAVGMVCEALYRRYIVAVRRLAEDTRLVLRANAEHRIAAQGGEEVAELACEINALAGEYRAMAAQIEKRASAARQDVLEEKDRLAALMSELAQSVMACNLEGRILLYNRRMVELTGDGAGADALVGLGRSIFSLIERDVIVHALEQIEARITRGEARPVFKFATALAGSRLVRVQMAPVLAPSSESGSDHGKQILCGFVLMLEDIQQAVDAASRRDGLLRNLTEGSRASLAGIRAAIETMRSFPAMDAERRRQFEQVIHDEARALTGRLERVTADYAECVRSEWPLETVLARDLLVAAQSAIAKRLDMRVEVDNDEASVWLAIDSYSLVRALLYLAARIKHDLGVEQVALRARRQERQVCLELVWRGPMLTAEAAAQWQGASLDAAGVTTPLTFEDVIARHGGQAWCQYEAHSQSGTYCLLLPASRDAGAPVKLRQIESRPGYYDFDLFHQAGQVEQLDRASLHDLRYTAFDTETTGLEPSDGDEIIAIGAIHIVNGRLLHGEVFEQLIDPARPLAAASTRIHGIEPAMLEGQPRIHSVLPRFHNFCEDTVLIAHNAAFDMRFLQLKEAATGVQFSQPVLDTLMLAAVVDPQQPRHTLEAIAERLGVNVIGRHTALGDAILTGEIFIKLVPLLAGLGIRTLKDAREASQKTAYARLSY